ncbi:winged helix-turn-helix domain-containing protein [Sphingomonadaceae bacterium OTU29MARTA1]|nr:winged helix-turn-helix domain-containing protein [Sphingomonadaceae bacterium OTU29MARTA1]
MDSYLLIARAVLKNSRQPLSARQILRAAHQLQLIPRELFGRTQHKTLQARLASDILNHRSKSEFYRTAPGRFYLRARQNDGLLPMRYRHEYHAPLRAAQLGRFDVVAFPRTSFATFNERGPGSISLNKLFSLPWRFMRLHSLRRDARYLPLRFLLILSTDEQLLIDNRKPLVQDGDFHSRSSVGLEGYVKASDLSLFSGDQFGLIDAAMRTLLEAFDLPRNVVPTLEDADRWSAPHPIIDNDNQSTDLDLITYICFRCSGIDPILNAIEDRSTAEWVPAPITVNDLTRFDKWSARLIGDVNLQRSLCT